MESVVKIKEWFGKVNITSTDGDLLFIANSEDEARDYCTDHDLDISSVERSAMQPIQYKSLEDVLKESNQSFDKSGQPEEFRHSYLLGCLKASYQGLCILIDVYHNDQLK